MCSKSNYSKITELKVFLGNAIHIPSVVLYFVYLTIKDNGTCENGIFAFNVRINVFNFND